MKKGSCTGGYPGRKEAKLKEEGRGTEEPVDKALTLLCPAALPYPVCHLCWL